MLKLIFLLLKRNNHLMFGTKKNPEGLLYLILWSSTMKYQLRATEIPTTSPQILYAVELYQYISSKSGLRAYPSGSLK